MNSAKPFATQHAIITGASRGIGLAIARELASLGAHITMMARDATRLKASADIIRTELSVEVMEVRVDVTKPDDVHSAFERSISHFGTVRILVNNAGGAESAPFLKTPLSLWKRTLDLNLTSAYLCSGEVLPYLLAQGDGRIVNIASTAGLRPYPYVTAYCTAKHGLIGLTRTLALETAQLGITVNAVCPGFTDTDLVRDAISDVAKRSGKTPEQVESLYLAASPQARFMTPAEVAKTVAWICHPDQKGITGQAIVVAGGEVMN